MNQKLSNITTIIWDMDGTLLDTLQDLCNSVNHALRVHNMPERTLAEIRTFVGNGVAKLVARAVPAGTPDDVTATVLATFKAHYMLHCQDNTCLYPGIADTLQALHAQGYRMAVVSNKLQAGVDELHKAWFSDTLEVAIGETPDVARKPAPDMVFRALKELGVPASSAVYVGDSEVDFATAQNAGLPCISVLWGFRDRDLLESVGATTFVERPEEILDLV